MEKLITSKQTRLLGLLAMFIMFACGLQVHAQNVTIRANNGSCIAAVKNGGVTDSFYAAGGFATWQHEQLAMVLTVADDPDLTDNGQLANPANNLFTSGEHLRIGKGQATGANTCYVTLSLPSGYRFTGYTINFSKPSSVSYGSIQFNTTDGSSTFGETGSDFSTYKTSADIVRGTTTQTITRTEMSSGDMSNVLYFKLEGPTGSRALISLESAEFYFTSEEDYSPAFKPSETIETGVSAVDIPYSTSKVDYGTIERRTYNGSTRVSYSSANVKDLEANFVLYEAESIEDGTEIDGINGKLVKYGEGTITSEGNYFKLGREDQEQIYFIETPTYVTLSDGTKNPVGYRIVAAQFDYTQGGGTSIVTKFYITYTSGNTTYYLNTSGQFVTDTKTEWKLDDDGCVHSGNTYIGRDSSRDFAVFVQKPTGSEYPFMVDNQGRLYFTTQRGNTYYLSHNGTTPSLSNNTNNLASWTEESETHELSASDFTLKIYDKTGANPQVIEVNDDNQSGTVLLTGLNNDAVKFGVEGIGHVTGTLTLQALDPYIDRMSVVCQDQDQTAIRMVQYFTASDFSVSGGVFYFFLPADCEGHNVLISYEELKSKYADETYEGGSVTNNSRYNFVKSAHYNEFGETSNNIYSNTSEASNAQKERLKVNIVGTQKFKFNNADEVGTSGGVLTEYPFSLEKYAAAPNNGAFDQMYFTVSSQDQNKTRYVFTTDETRYNIAPTTATQHRAYAYYQMEVHVQSSTYEPKVQFVPIYKNAFFEGEDGEETEGDFYGAVITAIDGNNNPGYSSTQEIFTMINRCIEEGKDDFDNTDVPDSPKQLLYLDFSQLAGVYEITTSEHQSMDDYSDTNAANCLIFIPSGQTAPNNNVAYKTEAGQFRAANNIVITDKQPFYSPYNILVDAANYAKYERKITTANFANSTKASIMLPFIITVDENGQHTNAGEEEPAFSLHQMQQEDCLSDTPVEDGDQPNSSNNAYIFFPKITTGSLVTQANTPYLVRVLKASDNDKLSFVVTQKGSTIYATTGMDSNDYTFKGETASGSSAVGSASSVNYNFTSYATYSGKKMDRSNKTYFYFANNKFVSSDQLVDKYTTIDLLPFRAYYQTTSSNSSAKGIYNLGVIFGEGTGNEYDDTPTDIRSINGNADMMIETGKGYMAITTNTDRTVSIYGISGLNINNVSTHAGERTTVNMPSGIYVVNGAKIVVK